MANAMKITFSEFGAPAADAAVIFVNDSLTLPKEAHRLGEGLGGIVSRAAEIDGFKGKARAVLSILAPAGFLSGG